MIRQRGRGRPRAPLGEPAVRRVRTVIVGAGFAGVAAAIALLRAGHDSFLILERAGAIGGTWRDNTYPGVACDVPSHLYRLRDHPWHGWSRVFAPGGEIRDYLERVVHDEGLTDRLHLGTAMTAARWTGEAWSIRFSPATGQADEILADHLVLACGRLTEPRPPQIPGLDGFSGAVFHSARWRHDLDLDGARVAVVGTGASAVQLVPELARRAEVTVFQRNAAWIMPRGDRRYAAAERRAFRDRPEAERQLRDGLLAEGEARFPSRAGDPAAAAEARRVALDHLAAQVPDPALRAALTPDYDFGCKRVLLSDDFYPALASGAVRLEPSALAAVHGDELVAASGARHRADAIVLATGFSSTRQPFAPLVTGEHGRTLAEHWSGGFRAVGSTLVHGFPNLFVLGGPNAALGHNSAVLVLEEQAAFAADLVDAGDPVRVTAEAEDADVRAVEARAAGTPWLTGGCRNWYVDERSGRLTVLWPGTVADFRERLAGARRELAASPAILLTEGVS